MYHYAQRLWLWSLLADSESGKHKEFGLQFLFLHVQDNTDKKTSLCFLSKSGAFAAADEDVKDISIVLRNKHYRNAFKTKERQQNRYIYFNKGKVSFSC